MKARSLLGYGISLAVLGIGSLPVFAQNSQEYPAASLPDGDYFYGQSRSATTYGTYFIFRKTGNIITGQQYNAPAAGHCFQGKIEQNTIVDITLGYLNDAFTIESGYHFVSNQEPINLNLYYRLRFDQASEGAVRGLQRCLNAFPNSQIVPQLRTGKPFIASNDAPAHLATSSNQEISNPAPVFRSILRDVQNQLPPGMIMRLPASIPILGDTVEGKFAYQPYIYSDNDYFALIFEPSGCRPHGTGVCDVGRLFVTNNLSEGSIFKEALKKGSPITLRTGVRGFYWTFSTATRNLLRVVIWRQDGMIFGALFPGMSKEEIINTAISMANENPVTKNSTQGISNPGQQLIVWQQLHELAKERPNSWLNAMTPREFPNDFAQGQVAITAINPEHTSYVVAREGKTLSNLSSVGQQVSKQNGNFNAASYEDYDLPALDYFPSTLYQSQHLIEVSRWASKYDSPYLRFKAQLSQHDTLSDGRQAYYITAPNEKKAWCVFDDESIRSSGYTCVSIANSPVTALGTLNLIAQIPNNQIALRQFPVYIRLYKDTEALGRAQFLQGKPDLISAQLALHRAVRDDYDTIDIPDSEFLNKPITDERGSGCIDLSLCPSDKTISYADYLRFKFKVNSSQQEVFNDGVKILEEINNYKSYLENDRFNGGDDVAKKIDTLFEEGAVNIIIQKIRRREEFWSLDNIAALTADSFFQTLKLGRNAIQFYLDISPALVRSYIVYISRGSMTVSEVENNLLSSRINPDAVKDMKDIADYIQEISNIMPQVFEAFLADDDDKMRDLVFQTYEATASLVESALVESEESQNLLTPTIGMYNNFRKCEEAIKNIKDLENTRDKLEKLQLLDEQDRSYLEWSIFSEQWNYWSALFSFFESLAKFVGLDKYDKFIYLQEGHKIADSIKSGVFRIRDSSFEQEFRRDYMQLKYSYYQKNQISISALSSFIDSAAQEVGTYLVTTRKDVVTLRWNGTIEVTWNGVLYPPN